MPRLFPSSPGAIRSVVTGVLLALCGCCPPADPPIEEPCPFGTRRPDDGVAADGVADDGVADDGVADDDACRQPWEAQCVDADDASGCLPGAPVRCLDDASAAPVYDCAVCGCAGTDACVEISSAIGGPNDGVALKQCLSAAVREGERPDRRIDDGLGDDEEYVGLFRRILDDTAAMTRAQAIDRLRARRGDDVRRSLIAIGSDEADTDVALAPLFDGSFGDVGSDAGCDAVDALLGQTPGGLLASADDGRVNVGARDIADDAACVFPGVFARCEFPSVAGCATARGILPETVLLLGERAILDADNALLRKATRANREQWLARIDAQLTLFFGVFQRDLDPQFFVDDVGRHLLFVVDEARPDVTFALDLGAITPAQLRTFRLMFRDATIQQFLTLHDITPDECTFDVRFGDVVSGAGAGDDEVRVDCQKNGASVVGPVFLLDDDISGLVLSGP